MALTQEMKRLADNLGRYITDKFVKPKLDKTVSFFAAQVVDGYYNGKVKVQKPFDSTVLTLPCFPSAYGLQTGDSCIVAVLGSMSNAWVIGDGTFGNLGTILPMGTVDDTSTATVFTATVPGITELREGVCCYLTNGVITSAAGWTLEVNGLGALPVYQSLSVATQSSTIFNKNYSMLFIYNPVRVAGGCWDIFYGYNDNTLYNIRDYQADKTMVSALYRYMFVFTARDGRLVPSCDTSNSTSTSKTLSTTAFDPFMPIYYYSTTTTVSAGSSPSASYLYKKYYTANMRYGWNVSTTSLTTKTPVYVRCAPQTDNTAKLDGNNCIVQALPSTADGKIYIFLGYAYSAYQIELNEQHPIYQYAGGKIQLWTGA